MTTAYDFSAQTIDGQPQPLDAYRGRVLLIVNVASQCGFTPQYIGLEALYRAHKKEGFAVLGFPCDQFGHQEPGDEAEIKSFCSLHYDVSLPLFAKIKVNGDDAHPLCKFLKAEKKGSSGAKPSNGTSPSSWSTGRATSSSATHRRTSRRAWRKTWSRCRRHNELLALFEIPPAGPPADPPESLG
jgi:glutathione peroxidase